MVTASATENSDLFWAIRGAGASYGVITNYKFQTYPATSQNINFQYSLNNTQDSLKNVHLVLQEYANTTMPAEMNMRLFVYPTTVTLEGVYYGTKDAFQDAIQPVLDQLGYANATGTVSEKGYIETLENYAYASMTSPLDYDVVSEMAIFKNT